MPITETYAKTIVRKPKRVDSWFLSRYNLNPYRGCTHNCVYCDGRSERYYVSGEFHKDIEVKMNAAELLDRALNPARKRKPLLPGYVLVGGGVCDSFQPLEKDYQITRKILKVLLKYPYPVHLLTKSPTIVEHLDLIKQLHEKNGALCSFSFSGMNPKIAKIFEPGVAKPNERLAALREIKNAGIPGGIFILPALPFITDTLPEMERVFAAAKRLKSDYLLFGSLTLRPGVQKDFYMAVLEKHFPELSVNYDVVYGHEDNYGNPSWEYVRSLHRTAFALSKKFKLPVRIPRKFYEDVLDEDDKIIVLLEHLDYMLKLEYGKSPYGYAAYQLSGLEGSIRSHRAHLNKVKGVGPKALRMIREILDTGKCAELSKYMYE